MSNKGANSEFANRVLLLMHERGLQSARRYRESQHAPKPTRGDVDLPGVTIAIRNQRTIDLSEAIREVEREAAAEGNTLWASVQARRGLDDVGASYVTTSLSVFLDLLAQVRPDLVHSGQHPGG